jgi:hypothetical protein
MDSVHCNSLLLLLGSKFLIGFHSPSNIEADSVHSQLQHSQLLEIRLTKWLHPCNQILMQAFQAYHSCRRLLLWSWIHADLDKLVPVWKTPMSKSGEKCITKYLVDYSAELFVP